MSEVEDYQPPKQSRFQRAEEARELAASQDPSNLAERRAIQPRESFVDENGEVELRGRGLEAFNAARADGRIIHVLEQMEGHDKETYNHLINVTKDALLLGEENALGDDELEALALAGLIHDQGKIKVEPNILGKKARLDDEERKKLSHHPLSSWKYAEENFKHQPMVQFLVLLHHQIQDHNYPTFDEAALDDTFGPARREQFKVMQQIFETADKFDAMHHKRRYQREGGLAPGQIEVELHKHFDGRADTKYIDQILELHYGDRGQHPQPESVVAA